MIDVNHRTLRALATVINDHCLLQEKEMKIADAAIKDMLTTGWLGSDASAVGLQWAGVNISDSTAVKFRESLKNYADALAACAEEYQSAQTKAVNAAGALTILF